MHINLFRSLFEFQAHVTWGQNLKLSFWGPQIHVSMRLDRRNTTAFELLLQRFLFEWTWFFKVVKLTWKDNNWNKTLIIDIIGCLLSRATRPSFQQSSTSVGGRRTRRVQPPPSLPPPPPPQHVSAVKRCTWARFIPKRNFAEFKSANEFLPLYQNMDSEANAEYPERTDIFFQTWFLY